MEYEEQGEANSWRLKDNENHWFAIVNLNGEFTDYKQREIMELICIALDKPATRNRLSEMK